MGAEPRCEGKPARCAVAPAFFAALFGAFGGCAPASPGARPGQPVRAEGARDGERERGREREPDRAPANEAPESAVPPEPRTGEGGAPLEPAARDSDTPEARLERFRALYRGPRHRPAALDQKARPTRVKPGKYACKISREYKLRDCVVETSPEGHTLLEVLPGNLLGLRGVLWDEGSAVHFEGWPTEEQPFGCTSCQDRCVAYPGTCVCQPLPPEAIRECIAQPVTFVLRGTTRLTGTLTHGVYFNAYVGEGAQRHPEGFEVKPEKLEVVIELGR